MDHINYALYLFAGLLGLSLCHGAGVDLEGLADSVELAASFALILDVARRFVLKA